MNKYIITHKDQMRTTTIEADCFEVNELGANFFVSPSEDPIAHFPEYDHIKTELAS